MKRKKNYFFCVSVRNGSRFALKRNRRTITMASVSRDAPPPSLTSSYSGNGSKNALVVEVTCQNTLKIIKCGYYVIIQLLHIIL
jgi:hypothetical protein